MTTEANGVAETEITIPAETLPGATALSLTFNGNVEAAPVQIDVPITITTLGAASSPLPATMLATGEDAPSGRGARGEGPMRSDARGLDDPRWTLPLPIVLSASASFVNDSSPFNEAATITGRRYSTYNPQMNLIAETDLASTAIAHEYVWFAGMPVAQVDALTSEIVWTFTDHLGTPKLQTDVTANVVWLAEHEPYGKVYKMRFGDGRHQPLRFPGQEAEQVGGEVNGMSERSYNIFRWYRPTVARYGQADPLGMDSDQNLYRYVFDNPSTFTDPLGLICSRSCPECPGGTWGGYGINGGALIGAGLSFGVSIGRFRFECLSNDRSCDFVIICGRMFGLGASGGITFAANLTFNAPCSDDIEGLSFGFDFDLGDWVYGSVGGNISRSGAITTQGEGGGGFGASGAFGLCRAFKLSCSG